MAHTKRNIVILAVIAVGIVIFFLTSKDKPIEVLVQKIDKGIVEATVANTRAGTVKACRRALLAPAIGGQIAALNVKESDPVSKDQILVALWNKDLEAQVRLAKSEARASRENAEETCLMADVAEREAQRLEKLADQKLTSDEDVDRAITSAKARKAGCRAARSRAQVAKAQLAVAEASLERTLVRAPFDGRVAEINGEVGEFVTPSPQGIQTLPVVDVIDTSCLYISAPIDEVDAPRIVPGLVARITLDAFPDQSFLGAVRRIAPYVLEVEKQSRTVDVEAVFMNPDEYKQLLPGYSADLEVILDERPNVLRLPTEALLEGSRAYVLADGVIEERKIKTGIANWKFTEVISGLQPGEWVVTSIDREGLKAGVAAVAEESAE